MRHVGIEHDGATVHILDLLLMVLTKDIVVLVVSFGDAVGS